MFNNQAKNTTGFTLIELLVVIAIIGIIAALAIVNLNKARQKSRDARRMADIKEINNAIQLYVAQNNHAPYINGTCPTTSRNINCSASVAQGNWGQLAMDLAPFIKKLPVDPCGTECGVGKNRGNNGGPWYSYQYYSPSNIAAWCNEQGSGCNLDEGELNTMYKIYAEKLETQDKRWGFQDAVSTWNSL